MNQVKQDRGRSFKARVLEAALSIPRGRVTTYGHLARAAGGSGQAARSVSPILARYAEEGITGIPWHRIVYSGGKDMERRAGPPGTNEALPGRGP